MNSLGCYFGPKVLSIVETRGRGIVHNLQLSNVLNSEGELEEKVPFELKVAALFKDELRKNNIQVKDINLALSGKDVIIRTFEMPPISKEEVMSAVSFEAIKYIPFKVEELVIDYQIFLDKTLRRNIVLLAGIKKEMLEKYYSIFNQLNLKIASVEYSAFSALRLLKLAGFNTRGVIGVITADSFSEDEVNFTVLENDFPLFSRDIDIPLTGVDVAAGEVASPEAPKEKSLDKLKTEISISLDYYDRKFSQKNLAKIFVIAPQNIWKSMETYISELGHHGQFVNLNKIIPGVANFTTRF